MMIFETKQQATEHLNKLVSAGFLDGPFKDGTWIEEGTYILHHGEYMRPDYKPVRYKAGWQIKRLTYYYPSTYNAPVDGPVDLVVCDGYLQTQLPGW